MRVSKIKTLKRGHTVRLLEKLVERYDRARKTVIISVLVSGLFTASSGSRKAETAAVDRPNIAHRVATTELIFSTYMGGSRQDSIRDVAMDGEGYIYITGGTESPDFPTTPGAYDTTFNGWHDAFVMKLNPSGKLIWSTFIGGPNYDRAYAIEVDAEGFVYVAGRAGSGFPTTAGVVQPVFGGDTSPDPTYGPQDGFVTKLSPDGSQIIWSTYFGSDDHEIIRDMSLDAAGNVYLAVSGVARVHPHISQRAFQRTHKGGDDGVVAKLAADGTKVIYASYIGGSADDGAAPSIRVDASGHAYYLMGTKSSDAPVTTNAFQKNYRGNGDLFLAKVAIDGSSLVYGTYFGGSGIEASETHGLSLDSFGNAYITASTTSRDLPVSASSFRRTFVGGTGKWGGDGFVAKLSTNGSTLLAGTYFGGSGNDGVEGSAVDSAGNVYIGGQTTSNNLPVTRNAFQVKKGGKQDCYVAKLSTDLNQVLFATYLGGSDDDSCRSTALDGNGNVVIGGWTKSNNFPLLNAFQSAGSGDWDLILAKFSASKISQREARDLVEESSKSPRP
jgi:beta-propeller repeat-containing protein